MFQSASIPSRRLFVPFAVLAGFALPVVAATDARLIDSYGKLPLQFEANQGQTDEAVRFLSRGAGYSLYLTAGEAVLVLGQPDPDAKRDGHSTPEPREAKAPAQAKSVALRMRLEGAAPTPNVSGRDALPGKANYFIGSNPAKWRTNVPTYAKVHYQNVYPGIDLLYYGNKRQLEYDFVVAPGADPTKIVLGFKGADKLEIDAQGDLVLHVAGNEIRQHKPIAYQEIGKVRRQIDAGHALKSGKRVTFQLAAYDRSRPLIIDPVVLSYSTYLGGSSNDVGRAIAVDGDGNAFVTGNTASLSFPTSSGAFQPAYGAGTNAFITKLNPDGSALVYSTFLGGSDTATTDGRGIAVDAAGNAYVTGFVNSVEFPITADALQPVRGGQWDAFLTKLNPGGSGLVYSTYLGGSEGDSGSGIAVDTSGNIYVIGNTGSTNFPTTVGAFQTTGGGIFVTKFHPTFEFVYSTYLGGDVSSGAMGIAVDTGGNAHVTGITGSQSFPTTPGAFQTSFGGGRRDAFVTKINAAGSALAYSTYLGGSGDEGGSGIALDTSGNAYVTGITGSTNFPTSPGAFQPAVAGGGHLFCGGFVGGFGIGDAFVTKLDPTGSGLHYSTYLGGTGGECAMAISVDRFGNAYVTGVTSSRDFPATPGAFQPIFGGDSDVFLTKLNPTGFGLVYSTFLGGPGFEVGSGIAVDTRGNAYATGFTGSEAFPTTPGVLQPDFGGRPPGPGSINDAFIAKIVYTSADSTAPSTTATSSPAANAAGWNNSAVTVALGATDDDGGSGVKSITYSVNAGSPVTVNGATASFTLSTEGLNTISFNATDNAGNAEASKTLVARIDKTPPSGTLSLSPSQLWPPNHRLVKVTPSLSVADAGGGPVTVSGPVVTSNEPVTGSGDDTAPDWVVNGKTLRLRAERADESAGRVYTVTYTLTDQAGNTASASATVRVTKTR
jgi:beta-propeller repeat-containing protein